jgi:hypothetical protein
MLYDTGLMLYACSLRGFTLLAALLAALRVALATAFYCEESRRGPVLDGFTLLCSCCRALIEP